MLSKDDDPRLSSFQPAGLLQLLGQVQPAGAAMPQQNCLAAVTLGNLARTPANRCVPCTVLTRLAAVLHRCLIVFPLMHPHCCFHRCDPSTALGARLLPALHHACCFLCVCHVLLWSAAVTCLNMGHS